MRPSTFAKHQRLNDKTLPLSVASAAAGFLLSNAAFATSVTQTVTYEYDSATGMQSAETSEPDNTQLAVKTAYTRDAFGNVLTTVVSSTATGTSAVTTRTTSTRTYDERGHAPRSDTNALGQTIYGSFDLNNKPQYVRNLNGVRSDFTYDAYGRQTVEQTPEGTKTKWAYLKCGDVSAGLEPCLANGKYVVKETHFDAGGTVNGPWKYTYFDGFGRELRRQTQGFDGTSVITVDTQYNSRGKVARVSRPYYANATIQWTSYSYDGLDRVTTTTAPDGSQVKVAYSGLTMVDTNQLNQTRTLLRNSEGAVVRVTDHQGNVLTNEYDGAGNLVKTTDPNGNTITQTYDVRGNRLSMVDPDLKSWTYQYDALGQMRKQTDGNGNITTITYDVMGRPTNRVEPDLNSTWVYDSCSMGKGQVCSVSSTNGYSRTLSYDSLARPSQTVSTMDATYSETTTYDANGRMATRSYPTGLTLKYVYSSLGYMTEIRDNGNNALYWSANSMDAEGHLLSQTYGNGVVTQKTFDAATGRIKTITAGTNNAVQNLGFTYATNGNLLTRTDGKEVLTETFTYDSLNRLTGNTVNSVGAGTITQTYAYDKLGNITSRSDIGTYTYGPLNNRPHAVTEITLAAGGKRQYSYDTNGNVTQEVQRDAAGAILTAKGRTQTYASFNLPTAITTPTLTMNFSYGPDHQRFKQIAPSGTTIYVHPDNVGGLSYEKETKSNGTVEHRHFITAGGGVVAVIKQVGGVNTTTYLHRDHLGSTTAATNATQAVLEVTPYEPFGKRRGGAGTLDANNTITSGATDRGFTNHEHLDGLALIHMNGRVYDPTIGRFLSADPGVPHPTNIQSYNRYAYTMNNPLVRIDPSGFLDNAGGGGGCGSVDWGGECVSGGGDWGGGGGGDWGDNDDWGDGGGGDSVDDYDEFGGYEDQSSEQQSGGEPQPQDAGGGPAIQTITIVHKRSRPDDPFTSPVKSREERDGPKGTPLKAHYGSLGIPFHTNASIVITVDIKGNVYLGFSAGIGGKGVGYSAGVVPMAGKTPTEAELVAFLEGVAVSGTLPNGVGITQSGGTDVNLSGQAGTPGASVSYTISLTRIGAEAGSALYDILKGN